MPRPLNFRQLEAFRAVMLAGSMTGGGQIMSISQPAVTRLIKDLEADLKLTLFHRQGAQIVPSMEGQQLYREVERHFSGAERIRDAARFIRESNAGYLHIGVMPNLATSCLPEAVRLFLAQYPDVVVSVHPESSLTLVDMMARGQLDIAYAVVPADRRDIVHDPFPVTHAVCLLPATHRLAARKTISVGDLDGEDFISLGNQSVLRMQVNAAMLAAGVRPNTRVETVHSATAANFVRQGVGIAVIDPFAAHGARLDGVVIRPFTPKISLRFSAIYRDGTERSNAALAFTVLLKQVVAASL